MKSTIWTRKDQQCCYPETHRRFGYLQGQIGKICLIIDQFSIPSKSWDLIMLHPVYSGLFQHLPWLITGRSVNLGAYLKGGTNKIKNDLGSFFFFIRI